MTDTTHENGSLLGKVCLITGGSRGVGKATARKLLAKGARVVIVARDKRRLESAHRELAHTGADRIESIAADLASLESVRALADEFNRRYDRLDVLINNAAHISNEREITVDGYEQQWAVNFLAPFLLSNLVLKKMQATGGARIVNIASKAHARATINFDDINLSGGYSRLGSYGQSKLALIMSSYDLARRLDSSRVTVNCLNPGVVRTDFLRRYMNLPGWLTALVNPHAKEPQQAAEHPVFLASAPELSGTTGSYFDGQQPAQSAPQSYDRDQQAQLRELAEKLVGLNGNGHR